MSIIVVGDVHGDLNQLVYPLIYFSANYDRIDKIIYLGDYIDRGESNVYIYEIIKGLIGQRKFIFLRGNHECFDGGTRDYIAMVTNSSDNPVYIKSFMWEKVADLPFDIVHYDPVHNILFSHSPLSRALDECLAMNDYETLIEAADYTFTEDQPTPEMTYRNIHGHVHYASSPEELHKFFTSGETKMVSIDCEASYGARYTNRVLQSIDTLTSFEDLRRHDTEFLADGSDVMWIEIYPNGGFQEYYKPVPVGAHDDFNSMPLDEIVAALVETAVDQELRRLFQQIDLEESIDWFKKQLHTFGCTRNVISSINWIRTHPGDITVYFNDVPYELYLAIGLRCGNKWISCHRIYYDYI